MKYLLKILASIVFKLTSGLLVLLTVLLALVNFESSSAQIMHIAAYLAPGKFEFKDFSGKLINRFTLSDVSYQRNNYKIKVEKISINWSFSQVNCKLVKAHNNDMNMSLDYYYKKQNGKTIRTIKNIKGHLANKPISGYILSRYNSKNEQSFSSNIEFSDHVFQIIDKENDNHWVISSKNGITGSGKINYINNINDFIITNKELKIPASTYPFKIKNLASIEGDLIFIGNITKKPSKKILINQAITSSNLDLVLELEHKKVKGIKIKSLTGSILAKKEKLEIELKANGDDELSSSLDLYSNDFDLLNAANSTITGKMKTKYAGLGKLASKINNLAELKQGKVIITSKISGTMIKPQLEHSYSLSADSIKLPNINKIVKDLDLKGHLDKKGFFFRQRR